MWSLATGNKMSVHQRSVQIKTLNVPELVIFFVCFVFDLSMSVLVYPTCCDGTLVGLLLELNC